MTKREAAIVAAYTGVLLGKFSDMHEYIEEIMEGPIWTHQLGDKKTVEIIKQKSRPDFINIKVS